MGKVKKDERKNLKVSPGIHYSLKELALKRKTSMQATLMWLVTEALSREKRENK